MESPEDGRGDSAQLPPCGGARDTAPLRVALSPGCALLGCTLSPCASWPGWGLRAIALTWDQPRVLCWPCGFPTLYPLLCK